MRPLVPTAAGTASEAPRAPTPHTPSEPSNHIRGPMGHAVPRPGRAMNDFVATLGARLQELSTTQPARAPHAARPAVSRARPRAQRWRPLGSALTATAGLATTAALFALLASTDRAELPVFGTPVSDASALRNAPGFPRQPGLDYRRARPFATPGGTGYVVASTSGARAICIAVPDAGTGSYGSTCTPLAKAERDGSIAALSGSDTTIAAVLLPAGAGAPATVVEGGSRRPVALENGVAVVEVRQDATLEYTTRSGLRTQSVPAPFSGPDLMQCLGRRQPIEITPEARAAIDAGRTTYVDLCRRR